MIRQQGGGGGASGSGSKPTPKIQVPPRASMDTFLTNGTFSPGPMTLISSLFPDQTHFSFSQLLVGAMASPIAAKTPPFSAGFSQDDNKDTGLQRNRPPNLVVAPPRPQPETLSPLFLGMSPSGFLNSPGLISPLQSPFGMSHQQALAHVTAQAALKNMHSEGQQQQRLPPSDVSEAPQTDSITETLAYVPQEQGVASSSEPKTASVICDKPANDGYNWRKYGQKHVKASECPRSYYKCTYPDCPVRKKVERSVDGRICEITYKGQHIHDQPQSSKRAREQGSMDGNNASQLKPILPAQDQSETNKPKEVAQVEVPSEGTQEAFEHHDAQKSAASVDIEDDKHSAKRRSTNIGSSHQTVTEAKIVLKTRSEVDLLDDGFRWRKYGQKVVKGNPYPRSYYRCTYAGCNVRKHVERVSADPISVITTYEGKHNHDLPLGRNSSQNPTTNASSHVKTLPESAAPHILVNKEIPYGSQDQKPVTLHLKEDQVKA